MLLLLLLHQLLLLVPPTFHPSKTAVAEATATNVATVQSTLPVQAADLTSTAMFAATGDGA